MELDELRQLQRPFLQLTVSDEGKAAFILEQACGIHHYQVVGEGRIDVITITMMINTLKVVISCSANPITG